jgi:BirA family biotin operon repressor/biotin-[acetyl-CoA-carboxylase] ligase
LATPYFQLTFDSVPSTQDVARERLDTLPLLVVAATQTRGRGRTGARWENADRALAASLALPSSDGDRRPLSLTAGVAACRVVGGSSLKWPNDVLVAGGKVGGILVERSAGATVIGLGLNIWWREPPAGFGAVFPEDPGEGAHLELAGLWGAELMDLLVGSEWPREEYLQTCSTIGREITWQPDGAGSAVGVDEVGALVVETEDGVETIHSGGVQHVRSQP